jgi:hypothetical protein
MDPMMNSFEIADVEIFNVMKKDPFPRLLKSDLEDAYVK